MKTFKTLLTAALGAAALAATGWAQPSGPQAPNEVIYLPQLPTAADLSRTAAAQGQTLSRIEQTSGQVTAVFANANGQTSVISYQILPGQPGATAAPDQQILSPAPVTMAQPSTPAPAVGQMQTAPPTTVVYGADAAAYPYDYYPGYGYYGPWYPAIGLGWGWGWGYRGWAGYRGWGYGFAPGVGFHGAVGFHGGGPVRGTAAFRGGGHGSFRR